jgi:hypothetical protein
MDERLARIEYAREYRDEHLSDDDYQEGSIPIFQDRYLLTEEDWDEIWYSKTSKTNPRIGDILTFTVKVNEETTMKMKAEELECPICYNSVSKWNAVHLNCAHVFCETCLTNHLDTLHKNHTLLPSCALCRTEYAHFEIPNPEISNNIEFILRK